MIDIHTHLLPGVDDGPETIDQALDLVRALVANGVTHAVLTPHVYPGQWNNSRTSLQPHFEQFVFALKRLGIPLGLSLAGEVRLNDDMLTLLARDELPTLGTYRGLRTMLLEMPDAVIPVGAERLMRFLLDRGICPILAHPERNKAVMDKPERLRAFVEMGCQVQLTAASVIGEFGPKAEATARYVLEHDWVHAVASDTHNLKGRAPRMAEARQALTQAYGEKMARQWLVIGPASLAGLPLPSAATAAGVS